MVAKMKYISITGHISHMNHVVNRYLSRYDIQLEYGRHVAAGVAAGDTHAAHVMEPFTTQNPYAKTLRKAERFGEIVGPPPALFMPMSPAEAVNLVEAADDAYQQRDSRLRDLEARLTQVKEFCEILRAFVSLDMDLAELGGMEFIHCRFGRFELEQYRRYERFLRDDEKILFTVAKRTKEHVFGVYFTPVSHNDAVDGVFASLEFHVIDLIKAAKAAKSGVSYTPAALIHRLRVECLEMETEITALTRDVLSGVCEREKLAIACTKVRALYAAFDVKKFASVSRGRRVFSFFGWMKAEDAEALEAEIDSDDLALFTRHADDKCSMGNPCCNTDPPPTLLKNLPVIRQFEFFTRLYGLPSYGEIDPTPVLAITYTLLFGLMFGDIGHGLVLALIGFFVQRRKPPSAAAGLGGIMIVVGISAAVFGLLYGSVFGFEFHPIWLRPQADINRTLIFAAALGAGLIALSMFLNMYNAFKRGKIGELLFGANGVAGLIFYSALIWLLVRVFAQDRPLTGQTIALAALPLLFISLKHPFETIMSGQSLRLTPGLIFNTAVELFETLLTYATNTISFVRVGAFAVSHAGMMHVVLALSRGAAGTRNILILILGNALVMLIEGLLVGIQVLRLDFYEILSRFYSGRGREFVSNRINKNFNF